MQHGIVCPLHLYSDGLVNFEVLKLFLIDLLSFIYVMIATALLCVTDMGNFIYTSYPTVFVSYYTIPM